MATDMSVHKHLTEKLQEKVNIKHLTEKLQEKVNIKVGDAAAEAFSPDSPEDRLFLSAVLVHAADLSGQENGSN
ncbi:hypothetical protein T484DRAFT_1857018 [Baffinella frigidus]|nr:hypothetical protein T484DRAFT_1857018 [Cryptophyta sp. CCMP2293]